jgi:hypothetical protein
MISTVEVSLTTPVDGTMDPKGTPRVVEEEEEHKIATKTKRRCEKRQER